VTPIVNGIVSLFGKLGKKTPAPPAPLPKMPSKPPVASGKMPPKPLVAAGNVPPPTVSQLQRLQDDVERRNRAIEEQRQKLADSRGAVRKQIELLKAKRDALLAKRAAGNPSGGVADGPQSAEAASNDILQQIEKLGELRSKGILTQREFDDKKAELLRRL
jgi:type IV secretory pathway VirB10-like protein